MDTLKSWKLVDVERRFKSNPESFEIPSKLRRRLIRPGTLVKLVFELKGTEDDTEVGAERMWVKVINRKQGKYTGVLDNDPQYISDLVAGEKISFEAKHIASIWKD